MTAIIRPAVASDISAMHRLRLAVRENRLTSNAITEQDYVPAILETGRGWVAEERGIVLGFAVGNKLTGNIWALFVDTAHEGRGLGTQLQTVMIHWLFEQGLQRLWLGTEPGTRAQRFYEASGWTFVRHLPDGEALYERLSPHATGLLADPTTTMHELINAELQLIKPFDVIEAQHHADALHWVNSGAELFRRKKPATPPKHLVAYFAVIDGDHLLLVDHKNAQLWLPAGGHVEPNEHPRATVMRELQEELGFACPHPVEAPVMITCTTTVGLTAGHTDVSLWYVVRVSRDQPISYDENEFLGVRWFAFADVPLGRADPHLGRFLAKLTETLGAAT